MVMNTLQMVETLYDLNIMQGVTTIGRSEGNDMVLSLETVSFHHAKITALKNVAYIQDLGSTNGTYVNGKLADYQLLYPGDHVKIGSCKFVISGIIRK